MDELEPTDRPEAVDFVPVRVAAGGRGTRSWWLAAAWVAALGGAVGMAAVGHGLGPTTSPVPAGGDRQEPSVRHVPPVPFVARSPGPPGANSWPLAIRVEPTAGGLAVSGTVLVRSVARVAVRLVDRNGAAVVTSSMPVGDVDGGIRPGTQPTFELVIGLPDAAVEGPGLLIEVEADNSLGATVGTVAEWMGFPQRQCGPSQRCP